MKQEEFELVSAGEVKEDADNVYFAWRQLEVSNRLQDQTCQFLLFCSASAFTPEFLTEFIVNYHRHGAHLLKNYSAEGNHLLFEAQRMVYAGVFFPELKDAAIWRESGINILNREIKKQVYNDGGQYELDPIITLRQSTYSARPCAWRIVTVSAMSFRRNTWIRSRI